MVYAWDLLLLSLIPGFFDHLRAYACCAYMCLRLGFMRYFGAWVVVVYNCAIPVRGWSLSMIALSLCVGGFPVLLRYLCAWVAVGFNFATFVRG